MTAAQQVAIRHDLSNGIALTAIARKYDGVKLSDVERIANRSAPPEPAKPKKPKTWRKAGNRSPSLSTVIEVKRAELRAALEMDECSRAEYIRLVRANY